MSEWKEYKLGIIANIISERVRISDATMDNYISTENMINDFGGVEKAEKLPVVSSINSFIQNDILFSNIRTYFKKVWLSKFNGTVSPDVLVFRAKEKICINKYLYYTLCNSDFTEYSVLTSKGAKMPRGDKDALLNYNILLPPLPEQTAIASILSSLDDKIDLLHRQNATLEKMAETLFRQWFVEEAKEEWEMGCLGDFLRPQKGRNITKSEAIEGKFPVVAGGLEPSCFHNQSNTKAPVITISASGANAGFVRLYYTPIWSSDSSFIDESITPYVFFFYIFLKFNQERLFDKQEGSAQPHIYPSHIMELELPKIPILLISNFESEISPLFNKIKSNQTQIRTLTTLRDTLLPKLMSGEVRVEY